MFLTHEELICELDKLDEEMRCGCASAERDTRQAMLERWVRTLPTPGTTVMHPSEYPARMPKYAVGDNLALLQGGIFTCEDLRARRANGTPVRILDPENKVENGSRAVGS